MMIKQRALAASRWAHDGDRVAASKRQRNVGDDFEWSVGSRIFFGDMINFEHRRPDYQQRIERGQARLPNLREQYVMESKA